MLDRYAIAVIRWPLKKAAVQLSQWGAKPDTVTLSGFFIGLLALPALALQAYGLALSFIVINRLFDGLDGAIAREQGLSDAGGFLDITLDFYFLRIHSVWLCARGPNQ
jgi:CDP-alcohol phosphatidyltransferase.